MVPDTTPRVRTRADLAGRAATALVDVDGMHDPMPR